MRGHTSFGFFRRGLSILGMMLLAACGGGGSDGSGTGSGGAASGGVGSGGSGGSSGGGEDVGEAPSALEQAIASGDASGLSAADGDELLRQATAMASTLRDDQAALIRDLYGPGPHDFRLSYGASSVRLLTNNSAVAMPYIVSDDGSNLAMVAQVGSGRGLAYGANVLSWMGSGSREMQHLPLFKRAFAWLLTGEADASLPATVSFITHGYGASALTQYLTRVGAKAQPISCDLGVDSACWQQADLLVFGSSVADDAALTRRIRSYLAAGKPVLYIQPSWITTEGGRRVMMAMGMDLADYPGNYWASAETTSVSEGRTLAQSLEAAAIWAPAVDAFQMLPRRELSFDFRADPKPLRAITRLHDELGRMQTRGFAPFAEPDTGLHRRLVLWADLQRPGIQYGKLSVDGDADDFMRAYASDSWLVFNRATTTVALAGQGDYMPATAQALPVSANWETIEVSIPQAGGRTAIGRGAVPGKTVFVEVVDDGGVAKLGLQTSYIRAFGNPAVDKVYARPRRPHSFNIPLQKDAENLFVTPAGGPLFLSYEGGAAGKVVRLRIKGSTPYAHFDFTRPMDPQEHSLAMAALDSGSFGWQTAKLVGGEIQQTMANAKKAIAGFTPENYVQQRVRGLIFDSNHIANGYANMPLAPRVAQICTELDWECTGSKHVAPSVQHFVGWIANCGSLCSGNPSDGYGGVTPSWGWWHELGHNTVQRIHTLTSCGAECNNNLLANASALRKFALVGEDTNSERLNHVALYRVVKNALDQGLSGTALRDAVKAAVWTDGADAAVKRSFHFQLAYLYTRLRHEQAIPGSDETLEYLTLLAKGDRLVAKAWDPANPGKYGMGRYPDNKIGSNEDLVYVLSSRILGRDLRLLFEMYGVMLSDTALASVADLGLPVQPRVFFALATGKNNQLATGRWIDMGSGKPPAYPF